MNKALSLKKHKLFKLLNASDKQISSRNVKRENQPRENIASMKHSETSGLRFKSTIYCTD